MTLVRTQVPDAAPSSPSHRPGPPSPPARRSPGGWFLRLARAAAWAAVGVALVVALWWVVALRSPDLPKPAAAFTALRQLLANPFYDKGPNDKGIGIQLMVSLRRVFTGFGLAALVGIPLGFLIGGSKRAWSAANPIVQVLRPVSPLAWFPIGLVVLKNAPSAAVFVIFITSLWPMVINTAAGASSVPADQRNVARVYHFKRLAYVRHVVVPHSLPSIVTGMRLSMGVAWMVIVAVEMLSGGLGIGGFVWNSYNGGKLADVIAAIVLIGGVGVALDTAFMRFGKRVA